jgi:hypothetical protein
MKLNYRVVTLSFCPDLVDPNAMSVPFAALVVGKQDTGEWTAFAMGVDVRKLGIDPLLAAMLSDVPNLIRSHFDSAMKRAAQKADLTPEAVLHEFHDVLRTNIHVSSLSEEQTLKAEPMKLSHRLLDVAVQALTEQLKKQVPSARLPEPRPTWRPKVTPESLFDVPPAHMQWRPQAAAVAAH